MERSMAFLKGFLTDEKNRGRTRKPGILLQERENIGK
jgi:hypothetical protein